jgi:hypothetical protein
MKCEARHPTLPLTPANSEEALAKREISILIHDEEWAMTAGEPQNPDPKDKNAQDLDLPDLWRYFQDRADMLKERQWTVGTWILTLLSGVAAFSLSQETLSITRIGIAANKPLPALMLGLVGILICGYGLVVVRNYGLHIQRNWDRADRVKRDIVTRDIHDLDSYWEGKKSDDIPCHRALPPESYYLIVIVVGFLILFLGIGFVSGFALLVDLVTSLIK